MEISFVNELILKSIQNVSSSSLGKGREELGEEEALHLEEFIKSIT
jgi:hypothetical protein